MNTTEIRNYILDYIRKDAGVDITDIKSENSYYLLDLGKNSMTSFKVKGCSRWLFGLWVIKQPEDDPDCRVELFGQHTDYIDEFKPTSSPVSHSARDVRSKSDLEDLIYKFEMDLIMIKLSPMLAKYRHYFYGFDSQVSPYRWLLKEFWYYRIKKPIVNLLETKFNKLYGKAIEFLWNLRYGKILKATYQETNYFYPGHEIEIRYTSEATEGDMHKLWHKLHGSIGYGKTIYVTHYERGETYKQLYFPK